MKLDVTTEYLIFGTNGDLYGSFDNEEMARECLVGTSVMKRIDALHSSMIFYQKEEIDSLFVLDYDGEEIWIYAYSYGEALVETILHRRSMGIADSLPASIIEYQSPIPLDYFRDPEPETAPALSPLVWDLLSALTPENKDLCAGIICAIREVNTLDELKRMEASRFKSVIRGNAGIDGYEGIDSISVYNVKKRSESVWHDITLWDFSITHEEARFVKSWDNATTMDEYLFRLFVMEHWGCYTVHYPYTAYTFLMSGRLKKYYTDLRGMRGV